MDESSQDRIQNAVEALADILCQESKHEIAILLKQDVLAPVAPIGVGISQVLCAVQFDDQAAFLA